MGAPEERRRRRRCVGGGQRELGGSGTLDEVDVDERTGDPQHDEDGNATDEPLPTFSHGPLSGLRVCAAVSLPDTARTPGRYRPRDRLVPPPGQGRDCATSRRSGSDDTRCGQGIDFGLVQVEQVA